MTTPDVPPRHPALLLNPVLSSTGRVRCAILRASDGVEVGHLTTDAPHWPSLAAALPVLAKVLPGTLDGIPLSGPSDKQWLDVCNTVIGLCNDSCTQNVGAGTVADGAIHGAAAYAAYVAMSTESPVTSETLDRLAAVFRQAAEGFLRDNYPQALPDSPANPPAQGQAPTQIAEGSAIA